MNKIKIYLLGMILSSCLFLACSEDEPITGIEPNLGSLNISASADFGTIATTGRLLNDITLEEFLVNVQEIELEADTEDSNNDGDDSDTEDDTWDDNGTYDSEDEIELQGPFTLDLLQGSFSLVDVEVPTGVFEEIEFEFAKNEDSSSDLFEKSILISGTYDAIPFEFWHDFEDEVEVDFEDNVEDISVTTNNNSVEINFDISALLDDVNGVDLSQAVDGDGDGIIEINPTNVDGNGDIADQLKDKLKEVIDLIDD